MRTHRLLLAVALLLPPPTESRANPIIDPGIVQMRKLPHAIAIAKPKDRPALLAHFADVLAEHGTEWLRPAEAETIRAHAALLEPALVASQRPGGRVDLGVNALLRGCASGAARESLIASMRGWLAPDSTLEGARRRSGTPMRLRAAHELIAWRDPQAAEWMRTWEAGPRSLGDVMDRQGIARLMPRASDPCAGELLAADGHGGFERCGHRDRIASIELSYPYGGPSSRTLHRRHLLGPETDALWVALAGAREDFVGAAWSMRAELTVRLTAGSIRLTWIGGDAFEYSDGSLLPDDQGAGVRCPALGALLEGWTSRPTTIDDR